MKYPIDLITILDDTPEAKSVGVVLKTLLICEEYNYLDIDQLSFSALQFSDLVISFKNIDDTIPLIHKLRGKPVYWDGTFVSVVSNLHELHLLLETSLVYESGLHKYGETYSHIGACRGNLVQLLESLAKAEKMGYINWKDILNEGVLYKLEKDISNFEETDLQEIIQCLSKVQFTTRINHDYREEVLQIKHNIDIVNSDDLSINIKKNIILEIKHLLKKIKLY